MQTVHNCNTCTHSTAQDSSDNNQPFFSPENHYSSALLLKGNVFSLTKHLGEIATS